MRAFLKRLISVVTVVCVLLSCVVFSLGVSAAENLAVTVESKNVSAGETVDVAVSVTANPGITILRLSVEYDTSILTLVGCTDAELLDEGMISDSYASPYTLYWNGALLRENNTATGTIATLKFKVADGVADGASTVVKVSAGANDILNANLNKIGLSATNGTLTVADKLAAIMPETTVTDPMLSIRFENKDADPYVSAGIRFRGTLSADQMADATEIGFVAAPYNAVASNAEWYMFNADGTLKTAIAKSVSCYDSASGKDVVYSEDNGNKSYQLVLTNLSNASGSTYYDLEIAAVMYVKTAEGYTYYRIASATFQYVYDLYVEAGII